MIRRTLLVAAAAVALIFAPTMAMAAPPDYTAPGYTVTVSDSSPTVGHPIKINVTGGTAHDRLTLTISGVPGSDVKQLNANGGANYSVNFKKAGTYTLTITDSKGNVVSTQVITVSAAEAAGKGAAEGTANSGSNMGLVVGGGLLALLAGAGGAMYARRRKSAQHSA